MATIEKLYKREWLNDDEGTAYIVLSGEKCDTSKYIDASIEIKDCFKQINLDFDYHDEESKNKRITKIDSFIDYLQEVKGFIVRNDPCTQEEIDAAKKKAKKAK